VDRPLHLFSIDDDPIFRLGLQSALDPFPDFGTLSYATTAASARERLQTLAASEPPDLVLLELDLRDPDSDSIALCRTLKQSDPELPIVLLSASTDPSAIAASRAAGANGYCRKGTPLAELVRTLRAIAAGGTFWQPVPTLPPAAAEPTSERWLARQCAEGLQAIEGRLAGVERSLQGARSQWDWLFWSGQRRELLTARWLIEQVFPVEVAAPSPIPRPTPAILPAVPSPSGARDRVLSGIQAGTENLSDRPLEIDILNVSERRALLYIVWKHLGDTLEELQVLQLDAPALRKRAPRSLQHLWQASLIEFFSRYCTPILGSNNLKTLELLGREGEQVGRETLVAIAQFDDLLAYLVLSEPLTIDNVPYRPEAPEARDRATDLLANALIRTANGIVQLLLNRFAGVESLKTALFQPRFYSTREIARFRNELSWRTRRAYFVREPLDIFESQYRLLVFAEGGIRERTIYAPRQTELAELEGLRWFATFLVEVRDAIAPRFRGAIGFLGSGAVFVLREVIGKGLGLVARGIVQGLGGAIRDARSRQERERDWK